MLSSSTEGGNDTRGTHNQEDSQQEIGKTIKQQGAFLQDALVLPLASAERSELGPAQHCDVCSEMEVQPDVQ